MMFIQFKYLFTTSNWERKMQKQNHKTLNRHSQPTANLPDIPITRPNTQSICPIHSLQDPIPVNSPYRLTACVQKCLLNTYSIGLFSIVTPMLITWYSHATDDMNIPHISLMPNNYASDLQNPASNNTYWYFLVHNCTTCDYKLLFMMHTPAM